MQKLKYTLLPAMFALVISSIASAGTNTIANPDKCPSAAEIKKMPLQYVAEDQGGTFMAGQYGGFYDTNTMWSVAIYNISASSMEDALNNAKKALENITGNPNPIYSNPIGGWICNYAVTTSNDVDIVAVAYKDNSYDNSKMRSLAPFFRK